MNLKRILAEKREDILGRWFDAIAGSYPAETARFLLDRKNRFANPVGHAIREGIEGVLGELFAEGGPDFQKASGFLDTLIRVRAVQGFSPGAALSFVFDLKRAVRESARAELVEYSLYEELLAVEAEIDRLALLAFDIYIRCREKVYDIKAEEVKRSTFRLLKRAKLITGSEEEGGRDEGSESK
jgi:hypothetical protein